MNPQPASRPSAPPDLARPARPAAFAHRRIHTLLFLLILLVAGAWRLQLMQLMPVISRDGVQFCWSARALDREGIAALRKPEFEQHPLYPASILLAERALHGLGRAESPALWQRAAQGVAWLSGMLVVLLLGVFAERLALRMRPTAQPDAPPLSPRAAGLWAMALAALLPLNTWLSADVMSEQLMLTFYVVAAILLLTLRTPLEALAVGLLAGLAFLTRPEGVALCAAVAAVLIARLRTERFRRLLALAALASAAFVAVAAPYWLAIGGFSSKADKQPVEQFVHSVLRNDDEVGLSAKSPIAQAALTRTRTGWHEAVFDALHQTTRAGRVVVPLLALPMLLAWRRWLLRPELIGLTTCLTVHLALCALLKSRHGYLDPRHTLPAIALLIPLAGVLLAFLRERCCSCLPGGRRSFARCGAFFVIALASLGTLAAYATRVPNAHAAHLAGAARWLAREGVDSSLILLGGANESRIAFYADCGFRKWNENAPTEDERFESLRDHLVNWQPPPRYFAIETGPAAEQAGHEELLQRLIREPPLLGRFRERLRLQAGEATLLLFELLPQ